MRVSCIVGLFSWLLSQPVHCQCTEKYRFLYVDFGSCYFAKSFFRSRSFLVESLGSFKYRIISSANRDILTSSFLIWIPPSLPSYFFLLVLVIDLRASCLLGRYSNTWVIPSDFFYFFLWTGIPALYWIKNGESRHHCLITDLRGNAFSFSSFTVMLAIGLSEIAFIMLRYILSFLLWLGFFIMKGCWILSKTFSPSIELSCDVFPYFVYKLSYVYCFAYVAPFFYSCSETHLIMVYDLLMCCILLTTFVHMFIKEIGL
jgi:hypothetical protein